MNIESTRRYWSNCLVSNVVFGANKRTCRWLEINWRKSRNRWRSILGIWIDWLKHSKPIGKKRSASFVRIRSISISRKATRGIHRNSSSTSIGWIFSMASIRRSPRFFTRNYRPFPLHTWHSISPKPIFISFTYLFALEISPRVTKIGSIARISSSTNWSVMWQEISLTNVFAGISSRWNSSLNPVEPGQITTSGVLPMNNRSLWEWFIFIATVSPIRDFVHRSSMVSLFLASVSSEDYHRLRMQYDVSVECRHPSCYPRIFEKDISTISIVCPSFSSIVLRSQFDELFFTLLAQQIHLILFNCQRYLLYSSVIDWSHPSASLPWLYNVYFRTFERRFHTLLAYLRTSFRLPALPWPRTFVETRNQLTKEKHFYYLIHPRSLNFTLMPFGLMEKINLPSKRETPVQIEPTPYDQWNRLYQPFFRSQTLTHPFESSRTDEQYTIVILSHKRRFYQLIRLVLHLNGLINLHRVVVLFNQVDPLPPSDNQNRSLNDFLGNYAVHLPSIHVEIVYLFNLSNDLNNRFLPWNEFISTDCVFSFDDDSYLRHDEIEMGFRLWKENRARLVGFISRSHRPETLAYDTSPTSCSYSMILTGAALLHRWYFEFYTHVMPEQIREYVQTKMNCEDIAMNFLVSQLSEQTPMKIGERNAFKCYKCEESLSSKLDHYERRSECLQHFGNVYQSLPLRHSIFRLDSLLNFTSCVA